MILDKYRLKKEQGTLSLKRVGPDVILTRDGEGVPDKKITSAHIEKWKVDLVADRHILTDREKDLNEAEIDIKKLEAIIDPDA